MIEDMFTNGKYSICSRKSVSRSDYGHILLSLINIVTQSPARYPNIEKPGLLYFFKKGPIQKIRTFTKIAAHASYHFKRTTVHELLYMTHKLYHMSYESNGMSCESNAELLSVIIHF